MTRSRWVQDPGTGKMVPYHEFHSRESRDSVTIMPDIKPFVSPITGEEITSRPQLAAHNKKHGVTNSADYSKQWYRNRARQMSAQRAKDGRLDRARLIIQAMNRGR